MEPVGSVKNFVPVKVSGGRLGNGGVGAVVNHLGGTLGSALFQEVDAHAAAAADDQAGVNAELTQGVDSGLSDVVLGELGDVLGVQAIVGQGNGNVGLADAVGGAEGGCLYKTVIAFGGQTEHDFTEGNNSLSHDWFSPYKLK